MKSIDLFKKSLEEGMVTMCWMVRKILCFSLSKWLHKIKNINAIDMDKQVLIFLINHRITVYKKI